jgi:hypothetical protein
MSPFYAGLCVSRGDEPGWIRISMAGFLTFPFFSSRKDRLSTVSGFGFGWFLFFWEDGWLDTLSLVLRSKCNAPQSKLSVVLWKVCEKLPPKASED